MKTLVINSSSLSHNVSDWQLYHVTDITTGSTGWVKSHKVLSRQVTQFQVADNVVVNPSLKPDADDLDTV